MKITFKAKVLFIVMVSISMTVSAGTIDTVGQEPYEQCGYCHEYDGNSRMPLYPRLAGQTKQYIEKQLRDFRIGKRKGTMQATAEMLTDEDISVVANYFSQQAVVVNNRNSSMNKQDEIAQNLFLYGDKNRNLQACTTCHGQFGLGVAAVPRLANQHEGYLYQQLLAFKAGERTNDDSQQMQGISQKLSNNEMRLLAKYLANLSLKSTKKQDYKHIKQ